MLNRMADLLRGQSLWGLAVAVFVGGLVALLPLVGSAGVLVALLGAGFLVLTLRQPLWGLAITLILAPFGAWEAQTPFFAGLPLPLGQLAWLGTCVAWVFVWLGRKKRTLPQFRVQRPLVLFIFITLLSLLSTESMSLGAKEVIKWLEILVAIWLVIDLLPIETEATTKEGQGSGRPILLVLGMVAIPAVIQGGLGIAQFIQVDGPESFLILGRFYRAYGTFQQPNPFGGFMAWHGLLALGIILGLLSQEKREERREKRDEPTVTRHALRVTRHSPFLDQYLPFLSQNWLIWLLAVGVAGITLGGMIASWSRGAWLGFAAGCVAVGFFWPRQRWWGVALLGLGAIVALGAWQAGVVPDSIVARVASATEVEIRPLRDIELTNNNYAVLERLAFWQAAVGMTEQNLWLGVGFGAYDAAYTQFAPADWPNSLGHAHNYYLNLVAEIGILGLIGYVVFWTAVVWQNIRFLSQTSGLERAILLGLLGCWTALSVHHLVDKLYVNNMYIHIGVLLALQQMVVRFEAVRQ